MLVLTRRPKEKIVIGQDIELEVVEIRHGTVRIGIKAPKEVSIVRKELQKPKEDEPCSFK